MRKYFLITTLCFVFFTLNAYASESPWFLDLNKASLYVKVGFELKDTTTVPDEKDTIWTVFPPAENRGRIARPIDLPEIPKPDFLSMKSYETMDFTYSLPFLLEKPDTNDVPGLHLASLGDNWEIFLNGQSVRSSLKLKENGEIDVHHSRRDVFFPIKSSLFNDGQNLLVIHIVCDPSYESNGFFQSHPYYFSNFEKISKSNASLITFALLFLYLFMGIYHIFLYFTGKNFRYNLFYGLFSIDLFMYLFMRTHIVYNLIEDTHIVLKIELICLFALLPTISAFLELITDNYIGKVTKGYALYSIVMAFSVIFTPINFNLNLLRIWQISGLAMILYIFIYLICWKFFSTVHRHWKRQKSLKKPQNRISVFFKTLSDTAIGNLFIGGVILVSTAIFDILDSMIFQKDLVLTNYGFIIFTLGSAFILANRFSFFNRQMNVLNHSLEIKIKELETASEKFKISEKKYRSLFEGNSDAVLLLNEDFLILDGNQAGIQLLGATRKNLKSQNIFNSLNDEGKEANHSGDLLRLKLQKLLQMGKPTELNLRFNGKLGEIKTVRVRLELIQTLSSKDQILFRAVILEKDALLDYFVGEKVHYKISNSFPLTDEVSRRITTNLAKYMDKGDAEILFIGLREIVINAIEHGNLNISFEEKTQAQESGRYMEFLIDRQKELQFRDKKVRIESSITPEKVTYRITDEGSGFDHKNFLKSKRHSVDETLAHGRGISMTLELFDKVFYNEKGNQVTLVKTLKK